MIGVVLLLMPVLAAGFAVVEFAGTFPMMPYTDRADALSEIEVNLQGYLAVAQAMQHSSVIVFPEYGLYSPNFPDRDSILPYLEVLPDVGSKIACGKDSTLAMVACLAASFNATVVVNMGEVVWLNSTSDRKQFNVNVVVTPAGVLLAKYRKQHLYYEPAFDAGEGDYSTHPSTFVDSVTGLTFGLLTCNDLTYQATMESIVAVSDVVIGPAWWVNLPPLMSGTAYFSSLSLSYNTTLAVAGSGMGWYCSGSGIYSRGKALGNFYNPNYLPLSQLVEVEDSLLNSLAPICTRNTPTPRLVHPSAPVVKPPFLSFLHTAADSNATLLRFTPPSPGDSFTHTVTSPLGLVCHVTGTVSSTSTATVEDPVTLAVVSIRGLAPDLGFPQWGIEFCGVVACPTDNCLSALVLSSNVTLSSVQISANFNLEKYRLFPILLESEAQVVPDTHAACERVDLTASGALSCSNISTASTEGTLSMALLGMEVQ